MAEGARLESVYTGNRIGGSNPSLSASIFTAENFWMPFFSQKDGIANSNQSHISKIRPQGRTFEKHARNARLATS